jgi:hypothetical protein
MIWILVCGAGAVVGVVLHDYLEGEALLRDLWDEAAIFRSELSTLDRQWAENPERSQAIVSLTTIPSRLAVIDETLKSLMRQTRAPKSIRLYVPEFSVREQSAYVVPERIRTLASVEIVTCRDWGPATKIIPAVQDCEAGQAIIVVDDDRIYPTTLIADLEDAGRRMPDHALALSGWVVPADLIDRPTTVLSNVLKRPPAPIKSTRISNFRPVDIFQGLSGYLVRPEFFDVDQLTDYTQAPKAAFFVDDVWISAHCRAPIVLVPTRRTNFQSKRRRWRYQRSSLGRINFGDGNPENRNNTIMIRHFADRWSVGGRRRADEPKPGPDDGDC